MDLLVYPLLRPVWLELKREHRARLRFRIELDSRPYLNQVSNLEQLFVDRWTITLSSSPRDMGTRVNPPDSQRMGVA